MFSNPQWEKTDEAGSFPDWNPKKEEGAAGYEIRKKSII
jgi:hypothetical protein